MEGGDWLLILTGLMPTVILVLGAFADRRHGIFSPFVLMTPSFFVGMFLRPLAYTMGQSHERPELNFAGLFNGEMVTTSLWVTGFLIAFVFGYFVFVGRRGTEPIGVDTGGYMRSRVLGVSVTVCVVAVASLFIYLTVNGATLSGIGDISTKRKVETDAGVRLATGGQYLFLIQFALANSIVLAAIWWRHLKIRRSNALWFSIIACVAVVGITGFLISSRRTVLFALLPVLTVLHFEGRLPTRRLILGGLGLLFVFNLIFVLRGAGRTGLTIGDVPSRMVSIEPFTKTADGPEISKLTRIMGRYNEPQDYLWGGTVRDSLLGLVPRTLWPNKPNFSLGAKVTEEVYGFTPGRGTGGQTASALGEWVINFGPVGLVLGGFVMGLVSAFVMRLVFPTPDSSLLQILTFLVIHPGLTIYAYLNSVSAALNYTLLTAVQCGMLYVVYQAIGRLKNRPNLLTDDPYRDDDYDQLVAELEAT